ncbi:MAG: c-type cytochrome [Cyclobacteriaceae bacterium]
MKNLITRYAALLLIIIVSSCEQERFDAEVEIPNFSFPETNSFDDNLSSYRIFEGTMADLEPSEGFELLELSSSLFTDYAHKQRLVKIPEGSSITKLNNGSLNFPDGTILTKTFFYVNDERDAKLGKRIIETRLEIKQNGKWNIATYIWNESQTDATLELNGSDTEVSWINEKGILNSTNYHVPTQNECMACHQSNSQIAPIGPSLLNLNRNINRNGSVMNQLKHLQSLRILDDFSLINLPQMVDYTDVNASLSERGRAYLAMNCAHCHNPDAWDIPAERDFDFRHKTPFEQTGIQFEKDRISRNITNGEMPFIGTTLLDEEGVALLVEYLESL